MPFAGFKNHADCVRKVSHRKNPPTDPDAYCAWIRRKVEGGDPSFLALLSDPDAVYQLYLQEIAVKLAFGEYKSHTDCYNKNKGKMRDAHAFCSWLEKQIKGGWWALEALFGRDLLLEGMLQLMTRSKANTVLDRPERLRSDADAVVIDDHRWVHVWANAVKDGKNVFLSKEQIRRLHDILVDEMARRGMDAGLSHRTPIKFEILELAAKLTSLETLINSRRAFLLDPEFGCIVGSSVLGKKDADLDLLMKATRTPGFKKLFRENLPEKLEVHFVWEPSGPHGPYIPAYELWAIPVKKPQWKEPVFTIQPLSPLPPAFPKTTITDPRDLYEDSYYVESMDGLRVMIHRRESLLLAFDKALEEVDLPEQVATDLLSIGDPTTFILDGFLAREENRPIYRMIDMPWWRRSEHLLQTAEGRRHFLNKLPELEHVRISRGHYFSNRADTVAFLRDEAGPFLLIPGTAPYPVEGASEWLLYQIEAEELQLQEGSDAQIKRLVDGGQWEGKSAAERFRLMTKRKRIEPLYPFAQMKTTKKGYAQKEVFGLKSVKDLAKDLFKVPTKQSVEVKIDGFRVQVHKKGDQVRLFTESGHEITKQIPKVAESVKGLPAKSFALDSEATPYDENLNNLGRSGAAPAFAKGAKGPVDDSRWALHVFDILEIDGEQLHSLPYQERRQRLRGIELPIRDHPKSTGDFRLHLWENHVNWATSAEQMIKFAAQVAKVPGSEGAMFKDASSKYRLSGNTPLWSKMKSSFEIDAIVVGVNRDGSTFNYVGAIGPVDAEADATAPLDSPKGKKFVKWKGKTYSILGKTFNTKIEADVGDIIRVTMKNVSKIDDKVYHWFHPQVLEKREDKTTPDPIETARTIYETSTGKAKKSAYLVAARFGEQSPIACCDAPWVAIPGEEWTYLANLREVCSELHSMGIEEILGSRMDRETLELLFENQMTFEPTAAETIVDHQAGIYEDSDLPSTADVNVDRLRQFLDEIRSEPFESLKLSCGAHVALHPLKKLANLFLTYPDEGKKWRYAVQFHARGLSVHGDLRMQVSSSQAIGWTWDTGKSLLKPMLKRTPREQRVKAGLSASDFNLPPGELSEKLKSTTEGRKLYKALRVKTQELKFETLKAMMSELWKEHVDPILENPAKKILTQIKHPMSVEWLEYEREVPAGAVGATGELEGQFVIMDKGTVEYGAQKTYFHEYWLHGDRIKDRRLVVRRLATRKKWRIREAFAWMTFFAKPEQMPYAISRRAVNQDWVPPQGISAIPAAVRAQIPKDRQYWRAKNNKEVRNALVEDIRARKVSLRLAERLQFSVKRVWHKGPEVRRGLPVTRYWLLLHSGRKIYDAWDFGKDSDPLEQDGILARRRKTGRMTDLLKRTGTVAPRHPVSQTRRLKTHFDTSDTGSATVVADSNSQLRVRLSGGVLKGSYIFVKESGEMWTFKKISLPEAKKAMLLAAAECATTCPMTGVLHLAAGELDAKAMGDLLIISGPAIKPGEVLPMDGRPSFFTKEGIKKFWPSMYRQPIVILHGDLKGDVVGFVDKIHYDDETGWGWVDRGVIWHPLGIKLILEKKLPSFSIEVIPESVWDPEHKHEHVIGGQCVGLAVVPKGACLTCNPITAQMGKIKVGPGKIYKFGMTTEQFLTQQYWQFGLSTGEISKLMGKPRSTIESWMKKAEIPRRDRREAWSLRKIKELAPRAFITALGTGAFTEIPRDDCPQCKEARAGGKSRRNFTATMISMGNQHLLIDAPKGIGAMVGNKRLKPSYVLLEHIHEDVIGGLHELRPLKPIVFATRDIWSWLRGHYRGVSGQKADFEELYDFERRVIGDKPFKAGPFVIEPVRVQHAKKGDPSALGFKIRIGGKVVWHGSDVYRIPGKALKDVDIFIGDGASMKREISQQPGQGHTSIENQIKWAKEAKIPQIYFTQIGHVGKTHEELNRELKEIAPNVQALHDGAEIPIKGGNPGARFSNRIVEGILSGEIKMIVRKKPYQEYARQAIYLLDAERVHGLYVEGFPEGPLPADKVREEMRDQHGLSDREWKILIGDAEKVWIYRPRLLFKHPESRAYRIPELMIGPYVHNVTLVA